MRGKAVRLVFVSKSVPHPLPLPQSLKKYVILYLKMAKKSGHLQGNLSNLLKHSPGESRTICDTDTLPSVHA